NKQGLTPYLLSLPFEQDPKVQSLKFHILYALHEPEALPYLLDRLQKASPEEKRHLFHVMSNTGYRHSYEWDPGAADQFRQSIAGVLLGSLVPETGPEMRTEILQFLSKDGGMTDDLKKKVRDLYAGLPQWTGAEAMELPLFLDTKDVDGLLRCARFPGNE